MITFSLQSGSNGNAIYVEADGVRLLFDAGFSGRQAALRMAAHGRDIREVDALILSHDHADHTRCAGIYQRKYGLPIHVTRKTHLHIRPFIQPVKTVREFAAGDTIEFGRVRVHTVPTPHDAVDGVAFVVECDGKRLGILTDLGHPFEGLLRVLETCHAAYLESNHDVHMLIDGSYPQWLKNRIAGPAGHLSNDQAADLLHRCGRHRLRWVALAHLSQENNTPELALDTARRALGRSYPFLIASRHEVSAILEV
jgi:phosphoribosyl 1,2-cyclic phosphodiesterase